MFQVGCVARVPTKPVFQAGISDKLTDWLNGLQFNQTDDVRAGYSLFVWFIALHLFASAQVTDRQKQRQTGIHTILSHM